MSFSSRDLLYYPVWWGILLLLFVSAVVVWSLMVPKAVLECAWQRVRGSNHTFFQLLRNKFEKYLDTV